MKPELSDNALTVLEARCLRRDPASGQIVESPEEPFRRVASGVAKAGRSVPPS